MGVLGSLNDIEKVNGDEGRQVLRSQYARMLAQFFDRMDLIEIEKKATVVHEVNLNSSADSSSFLPEDALVEQALDSSDSSSSSDALPAGAYIAEEDPPVADVSAQASLLAPAAPAAPAA